MEEHERKVEKLQEEILYKGFFELQRLTLRHGLYAGGMSGPVVREMLERGHAAAVLPYDPLRDELVLVEQFRIGALQAGVDPWLLEIVAGIIETGEDEEQVVRREAMEEAGCELLEMERICRYLVSPGGCSEQITLFCGRIHSQQAGGLYGLAEENEDIRATVVSFEQAMNWLDAGEIQSATPIIALQWLRQHRERLRRQWV